MERVRDLRKYGLFAVVALVVLVMAAVLAGCAAQEHESAASNEQAGQTTVEHEEEAPAPDAVATDEAGGKTLVAYFSATGTTERVATMIADATGGALYRIEPAEPYTDDEISSSAYYGDNRPYNESQDTSARPAIASAPVSDPASYTTVYVGYPIWYGKAPAIISTFLDTNDFSEATIFPFCTSGSSSITQSETALEEFYPDLNWMPGERFSSSTTQEQVDAWLKTHE